MEAQYQQFLEAVEKRDMTAVLRLIRDYPALHGYEGEAGCLVDVLDREAPELLEPAFQAGLSPDAGQEETCATFLQGAVASGDLEKVRLALHYGADPEKRNDVGEVPLGYACSYGQLAAARLLVEAGADVNSVEEDPDTGYRCTPLDCAGQYPEIVAYLRGQGARHLHELEPEAGE